jgi:hypothetical protein
MDPPLEMIRSLIDPNRPDSAGQADMRPGITGFLPGVSPVAIIVFVHKTGLFVLVMLAMLTSIGHTEGVEEMISVAEPFVDFELEAHDGTTVSSADFDGRPFLLFFYPKADTPG